MKSAKLIIITLGLITASTSFAFGNSVESNLNNIRDRVRACAILPYHYQNNNRVDHAIQSHCPEVKVIAVDGGMPQAKIKVAGHTFIATLVETVYSDGDVYDVQITDIVSKDSYKLTNVLSFGDVLLGVLGGSTNGILTNVQIQ